MATKIRREQFTGNCSLCSSKAKQREWVEIAPGRFLDPTKGYVHVRRNGVNPSDQPLWDAMKRVGRSNVTEHRFVMAKVLGRPLTSRELVDHMDGIKTNNDIGNLRLYTRGKNMPGETSGYGTFYHEWQVALARIRILEYELQQLRTS